HPAPAHLTHARGGHQCPSCTSTPSTAAQKDRYPPCAATGSKTAKAPKSTHRSANSASSWPDWTTHSNWRRTPEGRADRGREEGTARHLDAETSRPGRRGPCMGGMHAQHSRSQACGDRPVLSCSALHSKAPGLPERPGSPGAFLCLTAVFYPHPDNC